MASCDYRPATLNKRVTIQNAIRLSDGQGGFTETWGDAGDVYASIEPVKSWERYQAAQLQAPVTHKIVMRFTNRLTSASRLVYDGRIFGVKEVINENEADRYLLIKAIEQT